jgi:hypothetical protein
MKRLTRTLPLILAAALQLLPLLRNIVTSPVAGSSFAFILRWGIGTAGAYDSISRASAPVIFNSPTNFSGTAGIFFTNIVTLTNNGGDAGAYFILSNSVGYTAVSPGPLLNGNTTTVGMPPGLTFKCVDLNNGGSPQLIYGAIYGTPTTTVTNFVIKVTSGHPAVSFLVSTNIYITILSSSSPPTITSQPASLTTNVGNPVTFSVTNGGTAPFKYQWYFNTNTALLNQTNAVVTLPSVQLTHTGTYSVAITNAAGSTNSSFALLTVWQPPVITNQPAGLTNVAGGNATFNVVAGGVPALAYQWKFNTNTALLNSTNTALPLAGLRASQAGFYTVVITNNAGSVTSSVASLVITNPLPPPLTASGTGSSSFQFTFTPVAGLTNTVLTNGAIVGGIWNVFTNIPPPATASPITIIDSPGSPSRFYRVQVVP